MIADTLYGHPVKDQRVLIYTETQVRELLGPWNDIERRIQLASVTWRVGVTDVSKRANPSNSYRITLPDSLRYHANILPGNEVAIYGVGDAVMVCEFKHWKQHYSGALGT